MKLTAIPFILFLFLSITTIAQDNERIINTVEVINEFENLFRYQNFYLAGQPSLEELQWLKSQGVTKIINLRSEQENNQYSEYAYNELRMAKELGFEYDTIPVNGLKDFNPGKLDDFICHINKDEKILIHCRSAGRVTHFLWPG